MWSDTVANAHSIGTDLTEFEILHSLEKGGATKNSIANEPIKHYSKKIKKIAKMSEAFSDLAQEIRTKIQELVARDKELANQLKGLVS